MAEAESSVPSDPEAVSTAEPCRESTVASVIAIFIENVQEIYGIFRMFSRGKARYLGNISGISRNKFRWFYVIFVARPSTAFTLRVSSRFSFTRGRNVSCSKKQRTNNGSSMTEMWWAWKSGSVDHQTDRPNPQWKVLFCFRILRVSLKQLVAYYNNYRSRFRLSRKKTINSIFRRPSSRIKPTVHHTKWYTKSSHLSTKKAVLSFHESCEPCLCHHQMNVKPNYPERLFLEASMSVKDANSENDHIVIPEIYK